MKLIIPNNIFATLIVLSLDESVRPELEVKEASLISNEVENDEDCIGLIPSLDLINNRDFFVSSKVGICFDGPLSNTYMYFGENADLDQFYLRGDISSNEVILAKIVMQERYDINTEFTIDMDEELDETKNYLITGNTNWINQLHERGISFSEQVSEIIEIPYQNFIFVSKNKDKIEELNSLILNPDKNVGENLDELLEKINLSDDVNELIRHELEGLYYDLKPFNNDQIQELLKLTYFHQILDDMFDVNFV